MCSFRLQYEYLLLCLGEFDDSSHNGIYIESQSLARWILEKMSLQSTGVVKDQRF
jgi:hypothetical protein